MALAHSAGTPTNVAFLALCIDIYARNHTDQLPTAGQATIAVLPALPFWEGV
jgi:hypothetical protein